MGSKQNIFGIMGVFLLLTTASCATRAATYYVATTGSDSNPGSEAAPFRTIADAVNRMVAGDTTYVRGGTYNETETITFKKSGTASAPIRLLNAPDESPIVDFGVTEATDRIPTRRFELLAPGRTTPIGWITIEGFEIRRASEGIKMSNAHDITIRRNWMHHVVNQGILGSGKNVLIDRNVFNHNGAIERCARGALNGLGTGSICNQTHSIYATGSNWVVTNNLIYDNLAYGITVSGSPWCEDGNCYGGGAQRKTDRSYAGANGWVIANNTFAYSNHSSAIILWMPAATNSKIINNIFYENNQKHAGAVQGILFSSSGGGHEIRNNLFYATAPGATTAIGGSGAGKYTESGNIVNTTLPGFVSAGPMLSGVPNLQLQPGSPAIDKGQSLSQVTWDHAGIKRPAGASFDIGAYEFCPPPMVCERGSPPPNPTGGGDFPSGDHPIITGPNGEICPSPYLPIQ